MRRRRRRRRTLTVAAAPLKIFMSCSNAEKRIVFLTKRLDYRLREMDLTWNREQKLYTVIDAASCISWNASIIRQKLRGREAIISEDAWTRHENWPRRPRTPWPECVRTWLRHWQALIGNDEFWCFGNNGVQCLLPPHDGLCCHADW